MVTVMGGKISVLVSRTVKYVRILKSIERTRAVCIA